MERLPTFNFHTSLTLLDDIYQYESGLLHQATAYTIPRKVYDFSLAAEIPIYAGGQLKNEEKITALSTQKQGLKVRQEEKNVRLQIITAYLKVLHFEEQQKLLSDKIKEDNAIIHQTKVMQKNGLVTNNEVLRAELQLANHELTFSDLDKEISIICAQLKPLLGYSEEEELIINTDSLLSIDLRTAQQVNTNEMALQANEQLQIHHLSLTQHELEKKNLLAKRLPAISGASSYKFANPNFNFFPPEEYLYRTGNLGLKLSYSISNLYTLKPKIKRINEQHHQLSLTIEEEKEQTIAQLYTAEQRLSQTNNKIKIAEKAILQAAENYRIVKTKYANQLSLITELMDADNTYLTARANLIALRIDQKLKYYQLQYILGNL
jgi:outer membrane protein